ncbi:hypothetical protein [Halomonas binhaiensis]|uniref:Periplasmic heavy metal sensor n=1 Tax=Halomonas binhaiensis TaxID=2562282 RepID=A0A5C1NK86_9GAMM|nr:hypothetical protein [Halomonas binhaiensis]QEM82777.1 hypothetical protein E4T21_15410 [Halomonas binhaiensis]
MKLSFANRPLANRSFARKALLPAAIAAALLPFSLGAMAGDKPHEGFEGRGPGHEFRAELLDRAGIDEETRDALKAASDEHHEAMKELNDEYRAQRKEILGEDGIAALKDATRQVHQERLSKLFDEWQLSDDDRSKVEDTLASFRDDFKSLIDQDYEERDKRHAAWEELRQTHHDALAEVLSDEQIDELKSTMMPPRHHGGPGHHGEHEGKPMPEAPAA